MTNLLLIDDSEVDRKLALAAFAASPVRLRCVESAAAGLEELLLAHYDVVVCDMMMPGEDGRSFAKEFSRLTLPTRLILASCVPPLREFSEYTGLNNYLGFMLKPVTPEKVLRVMEGAE